MELRFRDSGLGFGVDGLGVGWGVFLESSAAFAPFAPGTKDPYG